ncbi:MAG: glycosyltransferase [Parasporobacterium sp.]|nr:glycosyltransferase [Parasporobacterium sp.]
MMKNEKLISVIIPVYNTRQYLKACLESILGQNWKDLQILLIDDGSDDGSGALCDEYAEKDPRIQVIHQKNSGQAAARNAGLDAAAGNYITFADSDDTVEPGIYEKLWNAACGGNAKISICGLYSFVEEDGTYRKDGEIRLPQGEWTEKDYWDFFDIGGPMICDVVWNKLYAASIWREERFQVTQKHEDAFIMHKIIALCEDRISVVPEALYAYRIHGNSAMHRKYNLSRLDAVDAYLDRAAFLWDRGLAPQSDRMLRQAVYFLMEGWHLLDMKEKENKKRYTGLRKKCRKVCRERLKKGLTPKLCTSILPFLAGEHVYMALFRIREKLAGSKKKGLNG